MPQRFDQHLEYPIGILSAGLASMTASQYFDVTVNGAISLGFGVLMIVITHFVKRWLKERFPD